MKACVWGVGVVGSAGLIKIRTEIEEKHGCVFPALRVSGGELKRCFKEYDTDGSGFIDYHEFLAAVGAAGGQQNSSTSATTSSRDGGADSSSGFPSLLQKLHNSSWILDLDDANALFDRFDLDGDGKISVKEFARGVGVELLGFAMFNACGFVVLG